MATRRITLCTAATASSSFASTPAENTGAETQGLGQGGKMPSKVTIRVASTAGSNQACVAEIWGQSWASGARMTKIGSLYGGATIDANYSGVSNEVDYVETLNNPGDFRWLTVYFTTLSGTAAAFTVTAEASEVV